VEVKAGPSKPKAKVAQRSTAQAAEGEAGPSRPKAKVVQSKLQAAEDEARPSKPENVVHTTPQVKKIKIVPKPWRASEARMF
jgi:hypothetical protein